MFLSLAVFISVVVMLFCALLLGDNGRIASYESKIKGRI